MYVDAWYIYSEGIHCKELDFRLQMLYGYGVGTKYQVPSTRYLLAAPSQHSDDTLRVE